MIRAATAVAHPNIALIKYWGKRDEALNLPLTGSLSLTLDLWPTRTTVRLDPALEEDELVLDGTPRTGEDRARAAAFLDLVRARSGSLLHARVTSRNTVPTAAGLASSAAGFAALARAASAAYGLPADAVSLSRLARRGSGSAARSILPGVAHWIPASDDEGSYAVPVDAPELRLVIVTVDAGRKAVPSREAMRRTMRTSPYASAWAASTRRSLAEMLAACRAGDFARIGALTELNGLRMHAAIQAADPPIRYLGPRSLAVFDAVGALRERGIEAYATADAGPNVAVLVRPEDAATVAEALDGLGGIAIAGPGPGARLLDAAEEIR